MYSTSSFDSVSDLFREFASMDFLGVPRSSAKLFLDEKNSEVVFSVDLPGYKQEEIELNLDGDRLTVEAENQRRKFRQTYLLSAISMGLGKKYVMTAKQAKPFYENGVLEIRFPKVKQENTKISFS